MDENVKKYLSTIGKKGGQATSERKSAASKANGKKSGGRPRKAESELSPSAIYQRARREKLKAKS